MVSILWSLVSCVDSPESVESVVDEEEEGLQAEDLTDLLEPIRDDYGLPALGAALVDGGHVTALGAVGLRNEDEDVEVTAQDLWHLGSCTKAMTATLVAVFVEEGVWAWDTTLQELFPDLETMHQDYREATVAQLLSHRAGTWSNLGDHPLVWSALWEEGEVTEQRAWFVEQILAEEPEAPPGTTYLYSNSGYMVVGAALEAQTGDSWEELLTQRLFEPLGMSGCGFGAPGTAADLDQPWGHTDRGPVDPDAASADNPPALGPAGTVHCSLEDWALFAVEHVSGPNGAGKLLTAETYQMLHTSQGDDYSLGWLVTDRDWAGGLALTHSGSNTMWFATVWLAPAIEQAYLSVTNVYNSDAAWALDTVASELISYAD